MVKIAEENNKGLFLTVVVILAFAIFAGALRSNYYEDTGYGVRETANANIVAACREKCTVPSTTRGGIGPTTFRVDTLCVKQCQKAEQRK